MIELIVLFSASGIALVALLALVLFIGGDLVRRWRPYVVVGDPGDAYVGPAGGAEDTKVTV